MWSLVREIHRSGNVGAHHDERFLDRHDVDRLPGSVEDQDLFLEVSHNFPIRMFVLFWLL
jgi:hypothetical protein